MILELVEYTFNKNDHSWMEDTEENEYIENNICSNCKGSMEKFVFIQNKYGDIGLTTSICLNCGYIRRTKSLQYEYIAKHFSNKWLTLRDEIFTEDNKVFLELKQYFETNKASVLDVGCGNGDRLLSFKNAGATVYGVEPSENRSEVARNNIGDTSVVTGFAEKFLEESQMKYNIIYSFNVLQFVEIGRAHV